MASPGDDAYDPAGDSETDRRARVELSVTNPLQRYASLVDDEEAFFAACERPPPSAVRVSTIKTTMARIREALDDEGVAYGPTDQHPGILELEDSSLGTNWPYLHGWFHGQEEVSASPVIALDPQPGEYVWDTCTVSGSKTTQIAAMMDDEDVLVGNDNSLGRSSAPRHNAERLGVTSLVVSNQDARNFSTKPYGGRAPERDVLFEQFDRVLVDAPCSYEGICRKNPNVFDEWTTNHVKSVAGIQKSVLQRAVQVMKAGGTVVYSTCTSAPDKNEAILDFVLGRKDCEVVGRDVPDGFETASGIIEWEGDEYDSSVIKARRVYPRYSDTGGFFTAKLEVIA